MRNKKTAILSGIKKMLKEAAALIKKAGWTFDLETPENINCQGCQYIEKCEYDVKECCIGKRI